HRARTTEARDLRDNENLVGPRILYLCPGRVTAHINVSAAGIKWTKHVSGFAGHRFGCRERRRGGGRLRRRRWLWLRLRFFRLSDTRRCSGWLWSSGHFGFWPTLRRRYYLRG